jgi:amino-acid N-acetyltransferase
MELSKQKFIASLSRSNITDIEDLLRYCDLPYEDCREHIQNFFGIIESSKVIAIGALQYGASTALLRSIAVHPEFRRKGLASAITLHLVEQARSREVQQLYILTETAEAFFSRFGFYPIPREAAPVCIQAMQQFAFLCPASAQLMYLDLNR